MGSTNDLHQTPPEHPPGSRPDEQPAAAEPDAAATPQVRAGFAGLWAHPATVVAAAGVVLLLVTTLAVVTLRSTRGDRHNSTAGRPDATVTGQQPTDAAGHPVPATPTRTVAGAGPGQGNNPSSGGDRDEQGAPSGTPSTGGASASPSKGGNIGPATTEAIYRSASITLTVGGETVAGVDLDSGATSKADAPAGARAELIVKPAKIHANAKSNAAYAVWSGSGTPTASQCAAVSYPITAVSANDVTNSLVLCVHTSDGRTARVEFFSIAKDSNQKLVSVGVSYTTWKSATDV